LTPTLTTTAFDRSSLVWFEARSWKLTSKGLPSSLTQLMHAQSASHSETSWNVTLRHTTNGFIEIQNWRGQTLELLSPAAGRFILIQERNDQKRQTLEEPALREKILAFLYSVD